MTRCSNDSGPVGQPLVNYIDKHRTIKTKSSGTYVSVESKASGISSRKDPIDSSGRRVERIVPNGVYEFVEKRYNLDRMRCWTDATVVLLSWIGYVIFVVRRIHIDTVPAGGEENLGAETIRTVMLEEVRSLFPFRISLMTTGKVEAGE